MALPPQAWDWAREFGKGLPVTAVQSLAYGWGRVNGRVDTNAYMLPAMLSRDLQLTAAGQTQQTAIQLGTALLVTSIMLRCYLTDTNDDTSMLGVQVQLPNLQGFLIGDPGTYYNAQLLCENATWMPLLTPWLLFPSDQTTYLANASSALAGQATLSMGMQGNWIYGMI